MVIEALEKYEDIRIAENHYSFLEGQRKGFDKGFLDGQNKGFLDGQNKGFLDGLDKRNSEFAKAMLAEGEPIERIAKYTGLSADYIKSLI